MQFEYYFAKYFVMLLSGLKNFYVCMSEHCNFTKVSTKNKSSSIVAQGKEIPKFYSCIQYGLLGVKLFMQGLASPSVVLLNISKFIVQSSETKAIKRGSINIYIGGRIVHVIYGNLFHKFKAKVFRFFICLELKFYLLSFRQVGDQKLLQQLLLFQYLTWQLL